MRKPDTLFFHPVFVLPCMLVKTSQMLTEP